ncbi:exosome complex exonuclease RRP6 [Nematocida displodere]|uniref:Exosome complex exonuclease RRP6 n=1 Tax=Nematocida displodere TaxID=1805483 RepID=A0A177EAY4_9MICR|nr:exosome complex exonuclease RRP6 [Nematocida displodere]
MTLTKQASKLLRTLERNKTLVAQEKLLLPEDALADKIGACNLLVEKGIAALSINEEKAIAAIERALETIHQICADTFSVPALPTQKTVLITNQEKRFILSTNIPRPQIDFKDRQSKYTCANTGPEQLIAQFPLSAAELTRIHPLLAKASPTPPKRVVHVETKEDLQAANAEILKHAVIGVDVKSHSFRSYKGFICYIQASTEEQIYLFDMLALRNVSEHMTFLFCEKTVKIFYKLPKKKKAIEKDFGRSVPLALDVAVLSQASMPVCLLNRMIKLYLNVQIHKEFHLIDWRYRTLTREIETQLTNDVKYLIPLAAVISQQLLLQTFLNISFNDKPLEHSPITPEEFASTHQIENTHSLKEVLLLREFIAKQEDESPDFILTSKQVTTLLKQMPTTPEDVFSLLPKISSLFKANLNNFLRVLHPAGRPSAFNLDALKDR